MSCAMGSVNFTSPEWLETAVAGLNAAYANVHPYVAVILCLAGTAMNIVTVVVLTRPSMQSAVNSLLCAIALCDILVMTSVLVFVTHFLLFAGYRCDESDYNIYWAYFLYYHSQATVIFHATSIWLTVLLAQIRVFSIRRATSVGGESVSNQMTCFIAVVTFIVVCVLNVPNVMTFEIVETPASNWMTCKLNSTDDESVVYMIFPTEHCALLNVAGLVEKMSPTSSQFPFFQIAFWTNGVLFKVVPCLLLTFSIVALVSIIRDVSTRRRNLAQVMNKKRMPRDHTTPMLVAVLSIFLVAELPQGVLHVFNAIFTKDTFYHKIYIHLGDIMDVLSLINSAVNFIIYCAMSRKFRGVFIQIFLSFLPQKVIRKYAFDGIDGEVSRMRPTDMMTKSEQLALTSHRVSATSVLLPMHRSENQQQKMYSGNLLTTELNRQSYSTSPRTSFDIVRKESQISSVIDFRLAVPQLKQEKASIFRRFVHFFRPIDELSGSPQRRIKLMQCETSTALY